MPSLSSAILGVQRGKPTQPISICEVPFYTKFIRQVRTPFPFPNLVQRPHKGVHTTIIVLGSRKPYRGQGMHAHIGIKNLSALHELYRLIQSHNPNPLTGLSVQNAKPGFWVCAFRKMKK